MKLIVTLNNETARQLAQAMVETGFPANVLVNMAVLFWTDECLKNGGPNNPENYEPHEIKAIDITEEQDHAWRRGYDLHGDSSPLD